MVFGRQSSPRPERLRALARRSALAATTIALAAALISCGSAAESGRAAAFASRLKSIDTSISSPSDTKAIDKAFGRAFGKAGRVADWLSLLKRAAASGDADANRRRGDVARRSLKAFPASETLRAASCHAFLRIGMQKEALALFGERMAPDAQPGLWAEAFVASSGRGEIEARPSDYARLADALDDPRPYIGAAAASLASGDRLSASAWLRKALEGGSLAPPGILWDCGLYGELALVADSSVDPSELELMGDAAWKVGDLELARRRWSKALGTGPAASWRPYANLALLSGADGDQAESYWTRMKAAFLSGPPSRERDEAQVAYAAHLARAGRNAEARKVLSGKTSSGRVAVLRLAVEAASMSEGRYAVELERLAAERSDDPAVMEAALRELARRGMYGEVALLREGAARRGLRIAGGWFYEAAASAARGDYEAASALIASSGEGASSAEGLFALGSLHSAMEDRELAAREFSQAAALARSGRDRCASLKALGRELATSGDHEGSLRAYGRALAADPSDPEAAILARGRKK